MTTSEMRAIADRAAARASGRANRPDFAHYRATRDASANPENFVHAFIGALSVFVDAELWELAIEAACATDRREAGKDDAARMRADCDGSGTCGHVTCRPEVETRRDGHPAGRCLSVQCGRCYPMPKTSEPVVLDLGDPYFDGQALPVALQDYAHVHSTTGVCVKNDNGPPCVDRAYAIGGDR